MRGALAAIVAVGLVGCVTENGKPPGTDMFDREVQPILMQKCVAGGCHSGEAAAGGLDVTSYAAISARPDLLTESPDGTFPFLEKATTQLHAGGQLFVAGSDAYDVIESWLEAGAPQ